MTTRYLDPLFPLASVRFSCPYPDNYTGLVVQNIVRLVSSPYLLNGGDFGQLHFGKLMSVDSLMQIYPTRSRIVGSHQFKSQFFQGLIWGDVFGAWFAN